MIGSASSYNICGSEGQLFDDKLWVHRFWILVKILDIFCVTQD